MKNKIGRNVGANIIGKLWNIISIYIFVPLWIKILGIEGYGIITFYSVLLTILVFADAGLTATLTREYAKTDVSIDYKRNLLKTIEFVYIFICISVFIAVFWGAEWIVNAFLKTEAIPYIKLIYSVRFMGAIIAIYLLYSLYQGGLMGLQEQVCGNSINILYGIMRSGVVVIPLIFYPDILVFFFWQLFSIILFCLVTRYKIYNYIKTDRSSSLQFGYLRLIGGYAAGMMILTILASFNTQLDKLLVSHLLPLSEFSKYSLASTVGQISLMATLPIGLAFYPEITRLVSMKKENELKVIY
ncbi:lipopolysaccharide biosynthesis protein, partial [Parabacteroides sp. AF14-59]|uniref:lipopolysaccharide biosynthesis protein n=3 Tax=Parabacteroides TaxID=375288 RepID=UPI000FF8322E